jgi:hypothetical protein
MCPTTYHFKYLAPYKYEQITSDRSQTNVEDSQTFDRLVLTLAGATAHESNVWVLADKRREGENKLQLF